MASTRHLTWRIQNIPSNFSETRLKSCFHSDDRKYINIKSLAPDVNNYDGDGTLTATMLFTSPEPREPRTDDSTELDIDKDFIGFTPLNAPDRDVCADIIAVTGLAGHAFGSWAQSEQKMWLRDYLPKDIQNHARILIYGYESQLYGIHAPKAIVSDYGNSFLQTLMDLRDHPSCRDRPLILIGHSLGALIIKQVITDLNPTIRSRLPVRTLLFFGAPHNGLEVEALETLVKGRPTQTLISELKSESPTLTGLSDRFRHVAKDLIIHTYYESRPTKTVAQGTDGQWERIGEPLVMVQKSSALLNMDSEKTRMKVDGDHKDIARLRRGQGSVYPNVLRIIKDALQSASEQFTAAIRISEARQENNQQEDNQQDTIGSHDQNQDQDVEAEGEYDESNLICDVCYDEFPKYQKHYHCYICGDGDFNICQSCKTSKSLCPGKHDMIERQLGSPDESDDASSDEDDDDNYLMCNACEECFLKDQIHFHCVICNDGSYDICLSCRKTGRICPKRHKLVKRQLPLNASNTATTNSDISQTSPSSGGSSRAKHSVSLRSSGNSSYQNLTTTSSPSKTPTTASNKNKRRGSQNDPKSCRACGRSFNERNEIFRHLREQGHMVD